MKILILYPGLRKEAFSNLGLQFLINYSKNFGDVTLVTSDTQKFPMFSKYDLILASFGFENSLLDLPEMLNKGGMRAYREEITDNGFPPIIAGGNLAYINPKPFSKYVDVVAMGDGEILLPQIFKKYSEAKSKQDLFESLDAESGFWWTAKPNMKSIPSDEQEGKHTVYLKEITEPLTSSECFERESVYKNVKLIEITRGCGRGCKFCVAGEIYKPVRYIKAEYIKKIIDKELAIHPGKKFGLMGTSVGDHPKLLELLRYIREKQGKITISSIRAEKLDEEILEYLKLGGANTVTIAPETGNEKLRAEIGKPMKNEDVFKAAKLAGIKGFSGIKLYFMIGLPGETDEDLQAIVNLILKVRENFNRNIAVTISSFVPKPHTKFADFQMESVSVLKNKLKFIKKQIQKMTAIELREESVKSSVVQWQIANGDENIIEKLLK